jgi:hypothetical protein
VRLPSASLFLFHARNSSTTKTLEAAQYANKLPFVPKVRCPCARRSQIQLICFHSAFKAGQLAPGETRIRDPLPRRQNISPYPLLLRASTSRWIQFQKAFPKLDSIITLRIVPVTAAEAAHNRAQ